MKITYLIGNGFDLNLGLKTKYADFYKYYLSLPEDGLSEIILQFRQDLEINIENWSDLELALGSYLEKFEDTSIKDIIELFNDIQDSLADYINMQDVEFSVSDDDKKKLNRDLFFPEDYLTPREKRDLNQYKQKISLGIYEANVIIFNYTRTFEMLYGYNGKEITLGNHVVSQSTFSNVLKSVEHIHGNTMDNMILGVNDISQIKNEKLKTVRKIKRAIVKPEMNRYAGTLRDDRCSTIINMSDLICIFGMSIGETDKVWWNLIVKKLLESNLRIIIFSKFGEIIPRRSYQLQDEKDAVIDKLLSFGTINQQQKETIRDRIFVCFNSNMFTATRNINNVNDINVLPKAM